MAPKRPFHDDGGDGSDSSHPKRFKNIVREVMGIHLLDELVTRMEPMLRPIVRDEAEKAVRRILQRSPSITPYHQGETSGARGLLLHFVNKLASTIFTGSRIEAEDGEPITIVLLDAKTENRITSGPLASMKIDILVLRGDFGSNDQQDWSVDEFAAGIICEREGRRPLVAGEHTISLKNGVGQINNLVFTDNSSWLRSRKFRLAAKPASKLSGELRIREGRSEAFMVKDHRGASYQKHHPPHPDDDVWRLEKIAKDGANHKRLALYGVHKVRDFLQLYVTDEIRLRNILENVSKRTWDTIIEHANACVVDDGQLYAYHEAGQGVGLLFNSVFKVVEATFDGQNYATLDKLTPPQKALVENSKRQAYKNVKSFTRIDSHAIFGPPRSLADPPAAPFQGPNPGLQQLELPITRQDQPEMQLDFRHNSSLRPYDFAPESTSQFEVSIPQRSQSMNVFPPTLKNSLYLGDIDLSHAYLGDNSWSPSSSILPVLTTGQVNSAEAEGITSQYQTSTWPAVSTWGQGNALIFTSGKEGEVGIISSVPSFDVHMSRIGSPRGRWCKLRAFFKWDSIRRDVAAKRMWQGLCI